MKKITLLVFSLCLLTWPVCAEDRADANARAAAMEQAKKDYKVFLEQLKALNSQYKEITGEIREVIKEEGVPAFDEETGELEIVKPEEMQPSRAFGDVDIKETDKEMIVKTDLPGVKKDQIKIRITNNRILRIFGVRYDRPHGRFHRRIELPALARETGIEAKYEDGVLTVRIPKAAETKKEIAVPVR